MPVGTSSTGIPMEASTRPDAPGMSRALWAPWIDTSAQAVELEPVQDHEIRPPQLDHLRRTDL